MWRHGDRVWYEPSDGVRYAGVVVSNDEDHGQRRVILTSAYWYHHKGRKSRTGIATHIAQAALTRRGDLETRLVDTGFDKLRECSVCRSWHGSEVTHACE